jgi:hypothetical protein
LQIHTFLTDLAASVEKLENYKQQKDDMMKWVDEKKFILNDLSASPAKLHAETANQEIKLVKELLKEVSDARRKFMENLDEGELLCFVLKYVGKSRTLMDTIVQYLISCKVKI